MSKAMIPTTNSVSARPTSSRRAPVIEHVVIVVPACNEADRLDATLVSLERARFVLPGHIRSSLVVVADECTDRTIDIARRALSAPDAVIAASVRSAGAARCLGVAHALDALDLPIDRVWIASTDADTVVPADWLLRQLAIAEESAVAVAGVVSIHVDHGATPDLVRRFDETYVIERDRTHPHVHAANMGFRADAYVRAGGWNPLTTGEDHDLWNRLRSTGPVVTDANLTVVTDARRAGRAPDGFAADLDVLAASVA